MEPAANVAQFTLKVLTPMGEVLETPIVALRVMAWDGQLGVLAHHAPMIARLRIGAAVITRPSGERRWLAAVGGILRVKDNEAVMLVDAAEEAEQIDVERARRALERSQGRLASPGDGTDISRAELALARAMTRLRVAKRSGASGTG